MLELFKQIANEEDCNLSIKYQRSFSEFVILSQFSNNYEGVAINSLSLCIEYKGCFINIHYDIGFQMMGNIECKIPSPNALIPFKVSTHSHFYQLFNRNASIFNIFAVWKVE